MMICAIVQCTEVVIGEPGKAVDVQDPVKVCVHGARSPKAKRECIVQPVGPKVGCGGEDAAGRHELVELPQRQRWKGRGRPCHVACRGRNRIL